MSRNTDPLRDIYLDVAGKETITEHQQDDRSRDPIEEEEAQLEAEVSSVAMEDGLDDAVAGAEVDVDISA